MSTDIVEDDVLDVLTDEVDAPSLDAARPTVAGRRPASSAASSPASAQLSPTPLRAQPGRVVLAVRADAHGGQRRTREVEELLTRVCAVLAPGDDLLADAAARPHRHDPAAWRYWARVDAARARAVRPYDLTACAHAGGLLTLDVGCGLLWPVLLAVRTAGGRLPIVLTEHGPGVVVCGDELAHGAGPAGGGGTTRGGRADADLWRAAAAHAWRVEGSVLAFEGQELLVENLPVTRVLAATAVDDVASSHGAYAADAVLAADGYVRPAMDGGRLVVRVGHDDPRVLRPWEVRSTMPCCGID